MSHISKSNDLLLGRLFILISLILFVSTVRSQAANNKQPNVIIIITDDQGYGDVAANGNKVIQTPNMDELYGTGDRLTNFHAGITCAPSRSGLMSGAEGNRSGVWHTIGGCNILRERFNCSSI